MLGEVCCNNLAVSKFAADDPPVDSVTSILELELADTLGDFNYIPIGSSTLQFLQL